MHLPPRNVNSHISRPSGSRVLISVSEVASAVSCRRWARVLGTRNWCTCASAPVIYMRSAMPQLLNVPENGNFRPEGRAPWCSPIGRNARRLGGRARRRETGFEAYRDICESVLSLVCTTGTPHDHSTPLDYHSKTSSMVKFQLLI